ncbi:hypothetical protein C4375_08455 [Devosia sp. I507]|nr:hypothetical protein C4375_08455 [Devosia sp. I507]
MTLLERQRFELDLRLKVRPALIQPSIKSLSIRRSIAMYASQRLKPSCKFRPWQVGGSGQLPPLAYGSLYKHRPEYKSLLA